MSTEGFDVDAWLDTAAPPTRSVTVYGRGDLVARLQDLTAQAAEAPGDRRLGGNPVAAEIADLEQQIEGSALVLHVRGLLEREQRDAVDQATETSEAGEKNLDIYLADAVMLSAVAVKPILTVEQAGRLRDRCGQAQWDAIFAAISAASKETIDVPLSRLGLGTDPAS